MSLIRVILLSSLLAPLPLLAVDGAAFVDAAKASGNLYPSSAAALSAENTKIDQFMAGRYIPRGADERAYLESAAKIKRDSYAQERVSREAQERARRADADLSTMIKRLNADRIQRATQYSKQLTGR